MWNGLDKGGKTNKTYNFKGTGLRILSLIRFIMMTTTAIYTALIVYNFHFMTNFHNCDNFFFWLGESF